MPRRALVNRLLELTGCNQLAAAVLAATPKKKKKRAPLSAPAPSNNPGMPCRSTTSVPCMPCMPWHAVQCMLCSACCAVHAAAMTAEICAVLGGGGGTAGAAGVEVPVAPRNMKTCHFLPAQFDLPRPPNPSPSTHCQPRLPQTFENAARRPASRARLPCRAQARHTPQAATRRALFAGPRRQGRRRAPQVPPAPRLVGRGGRNEPGGRHPSRRFSPPTLVGSDARR